MAAKYRHTFTDINGITNIIDIYERGVSHTAISINCASPGYLIEWQGNGNPLYENYIYSSRVTVPIIVQNATDETFFCETIPTATEETYDIVITKNGSLFWVGTILGDQISYDRMAVEAKIVVNLTAVDGLSRLENYDFDFPTQSTFRKTGTALITEILNVNGLSDYFGSGTYFSDGMVFENSNKNSGANFEYIKFNKLQFRKGNVFSIGEDIEPMNCKEALESILSGFAAQIIMIDGRYVIRQVLPNTNTNASYLNYNTSGIQISSSSITVAYDVNDGDLNAKPVFSANPTKSYQPPLQGFKQLLQKNSGYVGEKMTFDTSALTIPSFACDTDKKLKVGIRIKTKQLNRYAGQKLRIVLKLYATNGSTTQSWSAELNTWVEELNTWVDPIQDSWIEFEHTSFSEGFVNCEFTTDAPGPGFNSISFEILAVVDNVVFSQRRGGGFWALAPGVRYTDFSGLVYIKQAYNNTESVEWEHEAKYKSLAPSPRNKNSVYPENNLQFKNGREIDVFALQTYNGSAWVAPGNWSDPEITGFSGDLPYLLNRNWINIYGDFVPTITGNLIDNGNYSPIKCIVIDAKRYLFNGGTYEANMCFFDCEWVGVDPTILTITDSEKLIKITKSGLDFAIDRVWDGIGNLKNLVNETTERVLVDVFTATDGGFSADPSANKDMVFKIKYDNSTKTVSAALEARSAFVNDVFVGGFNCGNAETDYSSAVGLKLGRAE